MEKKMYFDEPMQIIWYDEEDNRQCGIAYKDEIICACCGGVVPIEEVYEFSQREKPIEEMKEWINFVEGIL